MYEILHLFQQEVPIDLLGVDRATAEKVVGLTFFLNELSPKVELDLFFKKANLIHPKLGLITAKLKTIVSTKNQKKSSY